MIPEAAEVRLTPEDRAVLEARVRAPTSKQRDVLRARIVLMAAEGRSTRSIAAAVGTMPRTVSLWRGRFAREGLSGLAERRRRGRSAKYDAQTGRRILAVLENSPPAGFARWTGPLIAAELGDVHAQQVWRVLRAQKIDLSGRKSWCESNDPDFVAKAADVVGLYMAPPENAIVICVDEKPSIQALERAQGYLKLPNGRALTGHSHNYTRNGTTTLFAAFEVATGKVTVAHKNRRRRVEFLQFMNEIVAGFSQTDTAIHVILDNLSTHKPKIDRWLGRHKNVHFHFTPTSASWLNQVEIWFSILEGKSLHGASFTSIQQLREHIDAFTNRYNQDATPFAWTKAKVYQRRFKDRRVSQL
jgi:transposase